MSLKPNKEPIAIYQTNSFSENPMSVIGMGMGVGMGAMFMFILGGAPVFLSMAALIGGILVVYGYKIGKTRYELHAEGIYQCISLFIPNMLKKRPKERFIEWKDIKSYRNDTDFKRNLQEYEYLKLYLRKSPSQIWITNDGGRVSFEAFRDKFLELIGDAEKGKDSAQSVPNAVSDSPLEVKVIKDAMSDIKRKPSFYAGIFAKILTVFFILLTVALFVFGYFNGMRMANWFRLAAILLPGTLYMSYRVFINPPKD